jgi:hypothetical protein
MNHASAWPLNGENVSPSGIKSRDRDNAFKSPLFKNRDRR